MCSLEEEKATGEAVERAYCGQSMHIMCISILISGHYDLQLYAEENMLSGSKNLKMFMNSYVYLIHRNSMTTRDHPFRLTKSGGKTATLCPVLTIIILCSCGDA